MAALVEGESEIQAFAAIRAAETTGRPLGAADFVTDLERVLGRPIARRAPGRKPAQPAPETLRLLSAKLGVCYSCPPIRRMLRAPPRATGSSARTICPTNS